MLGLTILALTLIGLMLVGIVETPMELIRAVWNVIIVVFTVIAIGCGVGVVFRILYQVFVGEGD